MKMMILTLHPISLNQNSLHGALQALTLALGGRERAGHNDAVTFIFGYS